MSGDVGVSAAAVAIVARGGAVRAVCDDGALLEGVLM
jgi:hypothetical protein